MTRQERTMNDFMSPGATGQQISDPTEINPEKKTTRLGGPEVQGNKELCSNSFIVPLELIGSNCCISSCCFSPAFIMSELFAQEAANCSHFGRGGE